MMPFAINFGSPLWLWALLVIPVLAVLLFWSERRASQRLAALLPAPRLRAQLTGAASVARRRWRFGFLLLGLAGLIVTMAQPRWDIELRETHRRGLDVIVVVDVSKSMLATDIAPSRLGRAKLALQDLVTQLGEDRLGLIAFAGSAFLQAPLTIDYDAVLSAGEELEVNLIPTGGTNIGGAINLALEAFGKAEAGNRAILLLSDGEPTSDSEQADGIKAAGRAAEAGVRIFTLGFGTPEGSLIPLDGASKGEFVRDAEGQIVRTRLNESGLQEIARAGNGFYLRFTNGGSALRTMVQDGLNHLKTAEIDARTAPRPIERYQWPLGFALLSLSFGMLLGERRKSRAPAASAAVRPRRRTAAATALFLTALGAFDQRAALAEAEAKRAPSDALGLYRDGHYDQAYGAFQELSKEHPRIGDLQFDAGASAYKGKQYEQALDAFGKALTSDDPSLQAKSHYNFGNALFRRGELQKERQAKISDWRNAIQHYETSLHALKAQPPHSDDALAGNTAYNRDLVQHFLDEELKQPPEQKDDKSDQKDKKQQKNPKNGQGQQKQQQQPQQQQQQKKSGQEDQDGKGDKQNPGQQQQQQGDAGQSQPPDQQQKQDPAGGGDPQNEAPKQGDQQNDSSAANDSAKSAQPGQSPDPSSLPDQDKPRQRGDFNAQPNQSTPQPPQDAGDQKTQPAQEAKDGPEEDGKMSPAQARALLQSLKDEDAPVNLNEDARRRRDDNVLKDW